MAISAGWLFYTKTLLASLFLLFFVLRGYNLYLINMRGKSPMILWYDNHTFTFLNLPWTYSYMYHAIYINATKVSGISYIDCSIAVLLKATYLTNCDRVMNTELKFKAACSTNNSLPLAFHCTPVPHYLLPRLLSLLPLPSFL